MKLFLTLLALSLCFLVSTETFTFGRLMVCMIGGFSFIMLLSLVRELRFMHRYRDEYIACTDAVLSDNETVVDQVNRWTTHYYVHKTFVCTSGASGLDVGYRYSVRDRPQQSGFGGGDGSIIDVPFIS